MWEGNLNWGEAEHAVRVAFRPIWSKFRDSGPIIFTSETIAGNTLTLIADIDTVNHYPKLSLMLNDEALTSGTLY